MYNLPKRNTTLWKTQIQFLLIVSTLVVHCKPQAAAPVEDHQIYYEGYTTSRVIVH